MKTTNLYNRIFKSVNNLTSIDPNRGALLLLHDECKGYAIKTEKGGWELVPFTFINDRIGYSKVNRSLI